MHAGFRWAYCELSFVMQHISVTVTHARIFMLIPPSDCAAFIRISATAAEQHNRILLCSALDGDRSGLQEDQVRLRMLGGGLGWGTGLFNISRGACVRLHNETYIPERGFGLRRRL